MTAKELNCLGIAMKELSDAGLHESLKKVIDAMIIANAEKAKEEDREEKK
jgi:hypothetical protein